MVNSGKTILLRTLSVDEYLSLPEPIRLKIETCVNDHVDKFITSKALLETTRSSNGK